MESPSLTDSEVAELTAFLDLCLLKFVTDETTPTKTTSDRGASVGATLSPTYSHPEDELESVLLASLDKFERLHAPHTIEPSSKPKTSNSRQFVPPVSDEEISKLCYELFRKKHNKTLNTA